MCQASVHPTFTRHLPCGVETPEGSRHGADKLPFRTAGRRQVRGLPKGRRPRRRRDDSDVVPAPPKPAAQPGPCWGAAQGGRIRVQRGDWIPSPSPLPPSSHPLADPMQPTLSPPRVPRARAAPGVPHRVSRPQTSHGPPQRCGPCLGLLGGQRRACLLLGVVDSEHRVRRP